MLKNVSRHIDDCDSFSLVSRFILHDFFSLWGGEEPPENFVILAWVSASERKRRLVFRIFSLSLLSRSEMASIRQQGPRAYEDMMWIRKSRLYANRRERRKASLQSTVTGRFHSRCIFAIWPELSLQLVSNSDPRYWLPEAKLAFYSPPEFWPRFACL